MKLLICTQVVDKNHDILGFFHSWIAEFAKHFEQVTVICLEKGEYNLPKNVRIFSLGKEKGVTSYELRVTSYELWVTKIIDRLKYIFRFYGIIWRERENYNKIFIHMNSEYAVLGGWLWRLMGKRIGLWYVHKAIPWQLRVAEKFVDVIFTASTESCNLESKKIKVVGHGIDVSQFQIDNRQSTIDNRQFKIIYIGRISQIKNQELLIRAAEILRKSGLEFKIKLIGGTIYPKDEKYKRHLLEIVKEKKLDDIVEFIGSVPNKDIFKYYKEADLSVNLCPTGGMDKAVLESMAGGAPVIVLNKTFTDILGNYNDGLLLQKEDAGELAGKIRGIIKLSDKERGEMGRNLRKIMENDYSLENLIKKIII